MKKELLMATALVSTLGAASVAQAVTATMSGSMKIGAEFDSPGSGTDTQNVVDLSNFSVSLSETTDGGTTISTSFEIVDEGTVAADDDNAIKLTFTDGSALEILNAGNAAGTHAIAVPGAGGEQGVGGTSTNNAPDGIDFAAGSTALGVEWHSAADFLADGLKMSASWSTDNGAAKGVTARLENSWGVGATYVTTAGDTTLTIGGGVSSGDVETSATASSSDKSGVNLGVSAKTGDLTIGLGYGDGDTFVANNAGVTVNQNVDGSVMKAGASYVTGDITLALGVTSGEGKDYAFGSPTTADDSIDSTSASVTYAVASGVSAVVGYTQVDQNNEGSSTTDGGSAWYVGATMSF
jgi:predicted porin